MLGLVSPSYLGTLVGARKREGNFASQMLRLKARGPRWFGDQLVIIAVVAPPAPTVVVVARAVVVDVVGALSLSSGFYGVPGVAVGPEMTLDCRCRSSDSFPASLLLRRRGIQAIGRWRSSPPALRALV
jgi:hypothetical protein